MIKLSNGFVEEYHDLMQRGKIRVCETILAEYTQLREDMNIDRYVYDTTEADLRIDFMQNCVKLTKSPFYGQLMVLMPFQKAFVSVIYGFKMADTLLDRFKKILLLIARKNTKSEFCSALLLTELILGAPGSDIVCCSNDDSQTGILYEAVNTMRLMVDPKQVDTWKNQQCIRNKLTDSRVFKLTERMSNKEGRNIDLAVIDESHEMLDNVIVKAVEQSQSLKDNPKLIMITTEGFTNEGFLDGEIRRARKIISGEETGLSAERYLPLIYEQDNEQEVWQDRESWVKSNPSLGTVKRWEYLDEQVDAARQSKAERVFVLAKDFNIKQNTAVAWLDESDYGYDAIFDIEDFQGSVYLGAVDLAETTDLVCAKAMVRKAGDTTKYVLTKYFIPEIKLETSPDEASGAKYKEWAKDGWIQIVEGNDIDLTVVADWFYGLFKKYKLRPLKVGYDQKFAKQFLNRMDEYGIETEMVYQDAKTMSNAVNVVEKDLQGQRLNYQNNPVDRFCLKNASLVVNNIGQAWLCKPKGQAAFRIDGAVCFAIVEEMYRRYRSEFHLAIGG